MYTVSDRWDRAIRTSGPRTFRADFYGGSGARSLAWLTTPENYLAISDVETTAWSYRADLDSAIRRTASITIVNDTLYDLFTGGMPYAYNPLASEFRLYAGVDYGDSTTEEVPLGVFMIEGWSVSEGDRAIHLDLRDRSRRNEWSKDVDLIYVGSDSGLSSESTAQYGVAVAMGAPWYIDPLGANDAIVDNFPMNIDPALPDYPLPVTVFEGDYLSIAQQLATSIGGIVYFDVEGVATLAPYPTIPASPSPGDEDWILDKGGDGVMVSGARRMARGDSYSAVRVRGAPIFEGSTSHFLAVRYVPTDNNNPLGHRSFFRPTFGRTYLIVDENLTSYEACEEVAEKTLQRVASIAHSISMESVGNPALDVGDLLLVDGDGGQEWHLISSLSMDHTWSMQLETRTRVEVASE